MKEKELKSLLRKAKECRNEGRYPETLSILHQIVAEYPKDVYYYLLASTYFEVREIEPALEYADKALEINDKNKEACELKGIIFEKEEEWEKAEEMYLKALEIDYDFFEARSHLLTLYFQKQKRYEDTIKQCEFVLSYRKFDATTHKVINENFKWIGFFCCCYISYILLQRYEDAITLILKYKDVQEKAKILTGRWLHYEDELLYKLYWVTNNKEGIEAYRDRWLNFYEMEKEQLDIWEKEAMNGIIARQ
jgi:tetratricopeptide (TPR) repeat protein